MATEIEWLRELYIEDLAKTVNYNGNPRPRVRHIEKWKKIQTVHHLREGIKAPLELPLNDLERSVWIWSDIHFFHKNIIEFSERPFPDIETMHEHMIANHNEYVGDNDIVIWNGDVGFGNETEINKLLDQCNGYKILVIGNHDFHRRKRPFRLNFDEIHLCYAVDYPEVSLFLTHYPMENVPYPWVNIHGHLHVYPNPISKYERNVNVNCELQGYRPKLLSEVAKMAHMQLLSCEKS